MSCRWRTVPPASSSPLSLYLWCRSDRCVGLSACLARALVSCPPLILFSLVCVCVCVRLLCASSCPLYPPPSLPNISLLSHVWCLCYSADNFYFRLLIRVGTHTYTHARAHTPWQASIIFFSIIAVAAPLCPFVSVCVCALSLSLVLSCACCDASLPQRGGRCWPRCASNVCQSAWRVPFVFILVVALPRPKKLDTGENSETESQRKKKMKTQHTYCVPSSRFVVRAGHRVRHAPRRTPVRA